eukprot:TRINITY_DN19996_c0_g1_i1.p1 TRINITY_DN19996_c0_g1~~TRINITY_DN19996_c0_g1_i1.p1  ORF type:complete len:695 (+),score=169.16 TRINITY_DN19996_c0_g1_i1:534-2618(+)
MVRQGEPGDKFFVIERGKARVKVAPKGSEESVEVAVLSASDYFGEEALSSDKPRNATVEAAETTKVKVLGRNDFQALQLGKRLRFRKRKAVFQIDDDAAAGGAAAVKTPQDIEFIKKALLANQQLGPLVRGIGDADAKKLAAGAFPTSAPRGKVVITQGEMIADCCYVVQDGALEVLKDNVKVKKYGTGDSFGELALLLRQPRAATVRAVSDSRLWAVPRQALRNVMQAPLKAKLEGYAKLLDHVNFQKLTDRSIVAEQKQLLAESLIERTFRKDETIIRQGEEGKTFFILIDGRLNVEMDRRKVAELNAKKDTRVVHYFGERALIQDEPRAATVRVVSNTADVLVLGRDVFLQVVGDTRSMPKASSADMMEYNMDTLTQKAVLGFGGFGAVTLMEDPKTKQQYALKAISKGHILESELDKRVMVERKCLAMCSSPFIVRLCATFNRQAYLYFLMEPALGGEIFTLYMSHNWHGDEAKARFVVACVALALQHLHDRYIVYRDMKPENLLLDERGYCKITDLGLAKVAVGYTYSTCGTPAYFAPEMIRGIGHNHGLDWWTLGILAYELMFGKTPFEDDDTTKMLTSILQKPIEFPPRTSPNLVQFVKAFAHQQSEQRLPMQRDGFQNVSKDRWLSAINLQDLLSKKVKSPFNVKVDPTDSKSFDADPSNKPPDIKYVDPKNGWDDHFECRIGPKL